MTDLFTWTPGDVAGFGDRPLVLPHRLHEREDLVGDDALVRLLDLLPDSARHVYTMGTDPADRSEWRQGSPGTHTGDDLLRTVQQGRLWFNLQRLQDHDALWRRTLDGPCTGWSGTCRAWRCRRRPARCWCRPRRPRSTTTPTPSPTCCGTAGGARSWRSGPRSTRGS